MLFESKIPDTLSPSNSIIHRNSMYNVFWKFYMGKHWRYDKEDTPQLTYNYCKAFVDKSVSFLLTNGISINTETPEIEKILNKVWNDNERELTLLDIVQSGSVMGDVWVKVGYDDAKKKVVISIVHPAKVLPTFEELNDKKIESVRIVSQYLKENKNKVFVEYINKDTLYETLNGEEQNRRENTLGEIPLVHIKNVPVPFMFYGRSDLEPLISLNKEYNEKATDLSESLDYQGSPVVIIKGAKAKNLERGANKVWGGLPIGSSVDLLSLSGGLTETKDYLLSLKQAMHEMAAVPEEALGKTQPISNTSGVALQIRYQPLIEKTKTKRKTYGNGLEKVNELILKTLEIKEKLKITGDNKYLNDVIFNSPFPKDRTVELQQYQLELNMGIESRRHIAILMGKDGVDELMLEVRQDKEDDEATPFTANRNFEED